MKLESSITAKIGKAIAAIAITVLGVAIVAAVNSRPTSNDYIEYWSSAKLFLRGLNPYSSAGVLELEKAHGFLLDSPLIMLNPPWTLPLIAWLGFVGERVGLVLWILATAGCLAASISLLQVPSQYRIVAFIFAPVTGTFLMMQSSPFLLVGWAIFLRYHRTRPFVAGAGLALMAIKPHLFILIWIVLLLESIRKRSAAIFAGFAASLGASSALVTLRAPHVWKDYWTLIHGSSLDRNYFPTLPTLLRVTINVRWAWLALLPLSVAALWTVAYCWQHRAHWSWHRQGILVMFIAILTSPYGWVSDQLVLLPGLTETVKSRPRRYSMEILVVLNVVALILICVGSKACMWLPLGWLLWYLYALDRRDPQRAQKNVLSGETEVMTVR